MEEAAAMWLPDDMVLEILKQVKHVATLFRCATACKGWRHLLVADPSFLRCCLPEEACRSAPFPGFFVQRRPHAPLSLVPALRSVFGRRRRSLGSIPNLQDPHFFDHAVPLISPHGLLLVRLNKYRAHGPLAVCHLLNGTLDVLPHQKLDIPLRAMREIGYAILTDMDCLGSNNNDQLQRMPFFKVLVIHITMQYRLCTFSSVGGEPRWNMCTGDTEGGSLFMPVLRHRAAVCSGMARWFFESRFGFFSFNVNATTGNVSFTKIPTIESHNFILPWYNKPLIGVDTDGRLTMTYVKSYISELEIRTLHDNGWWIRTQKLVLRNPKKTHVLAYTCLCEKGGTLLIIDDHRRVYVADVKTGVLKQLTTWPRRSNLSRKNTVPLEMDWPAFLVSRLGEAT